MLTEKQKELYSRQLILPGFSEEDQQKLNNAKILVVGAGGLGAPVLSYLSAAGVCNLGIVEYDSIVLSNLQRQILFRLEDTGKKKIDIAAQRIKELNPDINCECYDTIWNDGNAIEIAKDYQIIIDCSDNKASRLTSDYASSTLGIPFVFGALSNWEGQVAIFNSLNQINYKEAFGHPNMQTEENESTGVIGVVPAVIGSIMASEAIKLILGKGKTLDGRLLHISLLKNEWQVFEL